MSWKFGLTGICSANAGFDLFDDELINESRSNATMNASDFIIDIREYDVPYHVRVSIDKGTYLHHVYSLHVANGFKTSE